MDKKRKLIAIALAVIFVSVAIVSYINKDKIFLNVVEINFADGCKEIYHNGVIQTPVCKNRDATAPRWDSMIPQTNITIGDSIAGGRINWSANTTNPSNQTS